jgi:hypothetical protein
MYTDNESNQKAIGMIERTLPAAKERSEVETMDIGKIRLGVWGCPDLTDSGLRVKNLRSPHEDTDQQTSS